METITRKTVEIKKESNRGNKVQVSFNSWGHLTVREWDGGYYQRIPVIKEGTCKLCGNKVIWNGTWNHTANIQADHFAVLKEEGEAEFMSPQETLIVFDENESKAIVDFVKRLIKEGV